MEKDMIDFTIHTKQDLIDAIEHFGFLPFFSNGIEGFSIEEHCAPEVYFSNEPGVWEWKGPVVQETRAAYGKFFDKKAGYVTKQWFYDFANYRRDGYDFDARFEDGLSTYEDQYLYNLIAERHSILSKDLKAIGGYVKPRTKTPDSWEPRKGFDTRITRLQMQCYVLTSDFEYETDKNGNFYGWGIARYATPEEFYGKRWAAKVYQRTPEESYQRILRKLKKVLPGVDEDLIRKLIG